jgi:hypothetical protein
MVRGDRKESEQMRMGKSYQVTYTFYTEDVGPVSSSVYSMAYSPSAAKQNVEHWIKKEVRGIVSVSFPFRPIRRATCDRYPGNYI